MFNIHLTGIEEHTFSQSLFAQEQYQTEKRSLQGQKLIKFIPEGSEREKEAREEQVKETSVE